MAAVGWYLRTQTVSATVEAPRLEARPVDVPSPSAVANPLPPPPSTLPVTPTVTEAPAVEVPAAAVPAPIGSFAIVVASFTNRARADRLVDELTSAGFRARAVERDWGPPRGLLVQVNVEGYTSALDVQRDLQRIRELPGGYGDARIVEQ
jgi:cell division septation protein DedD